MENYKIKQRLGKGAQGAVFLVEDRNDKKQYVLKKVECNDEGEANKAFKEAMALQELQHPYICGYKEFFVTWDKEESAMYVCIVMDYYKFGDLDKVLRQKRGSKENIEELVLKKWFGQMIEALAFVHKKQVIHRDLKPSNIFMTEDLSICIGDFGVATIMGDARTKTRTTVGSMSWMAPEVMEKAYDERSDLWSLGCITLEMASCAFMTTQEIQAVLFQIKQSPQVLEEVLEDVSKSYSADLCQMIRTMLRKNFKQRPSVLQMLEIPYIKDALALSHSALAARRKKEKANEVSKPVPKGKGVPAVLTFLRENQKSESCVKDALVYLAEVTKDQDAVIDDAGKRLIVDSMKSHVGEAEIQTAGCNVLANLVVASDTDDILYSQEIIEIIPLAMISHAGSKHLQASASALLMALSAEEAAAEIIGQKGGVQDVLAALRAFPNDAEIAANCCSALWSLAVNENNALIVTEEKGAIDICGALEKHAKTADVIEGACAALWSLSMEDDNITLMQDNKAVPLMVRAVEIHREHPKVVKNACMALASIIETDELSAHSMVKEGGLQAVKKAYKQHHDNPEVVENVCVLLMEMAEHDDIVHDLKSLRMEEVLKEAQVMYASNEDIMGPVLSALSKMSAGAKAPRNRPTSARNRAKASTK
ncbi:serine/threonine kinase-like domain-containing protein STKLD1 [Ptychodera flava]|uniref:serine/threonine kinase-like domain-containing protein STKLD1 n=1 Tax=Ptychodera flava TaxID=63121 RepID=UPI00396AB148